MPLDQVQERRLLKDQREDLLPAGCRVATLPLNPTTQVKESLRAISDPGGKRMVRTRLLHRLTKLTLLVSVVGSPPTTRRSPTRTRRISLTLSLSLWKASGRTLSGRRSRVLYRLWSTGCPKNVRGIWITDQPQGTDL